MAGVRRDVFVVNERQSGQGGEIKSFWTKVGSAFENKDGSVTVLLDALPTNGKLQIRDAETQEQRYARKNNRSSDAPF